MMPKELGELLNWDKNVGYLASFVQHKPMTTLGDRDMCWMLLLLCVVVVAVVGRVCCWSDDKKWKTWTSLMVQWLRLCTSNGNGLPRWCSGKESACQGRRHKRCGFDPWLWKIPWRRAWQPTPVFLPGESCGQRSLAGYSPWITKELDTTEHMHTHFQWSGN